MAIETLSSNDWNNSKCVPDVIIVEVDNATKIAKLTLPGTVLMQKGYKRLEGQFGDN